ALGTVDGDAVATDDLVVRAEQKMHVPAVASELAAVEAAHGAAANEGDFHGAGGRSHGVMEDWSIGVMEEWSNGLLEDWSLRVLDSVNRGSGQPSSPITPLLHHSNTPVPPITPFSPPPTKKLPGRSQGAVTKPWNYLAPRMASLAALATRN